MTAILRVGFLGCGEVVQILHLPTLREIPELFAVTALFDVSPTVLREVGRSCPSARLHQSSAALLEAPDVDVVVIASPHVYHAEMAMAAMRAGKHVLIEKPMCMTLAEADELARVEMSAGVVAQIGYMRRHAPAFLEAVGLVRGRVNEVRLARVHKVTGPNLAVVQSTVGSLRGNDMPAAIIAATRAATDAKTLEAVGDAGGVRARVYLRLLGLSSHDTSAMRELLGTPKSVLYAAERHDGAVISAAFDYGAFVCQFETGVDRISRSDSHIEVYFDDEVVRVDMDTPYVRHQPTRLTRTRANSPHGVVVASGYETRTDAFVWEWRDLHRNVAAGQRPKTSIADAREDLALFAEIMAKLA